MSNPQAPFYFYKARVLRWVDGDTVDLNVDLGFGVWRQDRFRLLGLNAPETKLYKGVTPEEKSAGIATHELVAGRWPEGAEVTIATRSQGKYGRYLVTIWAGDLPEGVSVNQWLVEEGHASIYGDPWESWPGASSS